MEHHQLYSLRILHQLVHIHQKRSRRDIQRIFDVSAGIVIIADIHHQIIFLRNLVGALDEGCELLQLSNLNKTD